MPRPFWKPLCSCEGHSNSTDSSACTKCGSGTEFDGWHYIAHERMANHQIRYGTKPMGPHRPREFALFDGIVTNCTVCDGYGLLNDIDKRTAIHCAKCEGLGSLVNCTPKEFEAIRQNVLKEFPDAAVHGWMGKRPSGAYVFDTSAGIVLDLEDVGTSVVADIVVDDKERDIWREDLGFAVIERKEKRDFLTWLRMTLVNRT